MDSCLNIMNFVLLRRQAGYRSAKEFAHLVGVSYSTYTRWERSSPEESGMPLMAAWRIADALGCTIDEAVGRCAPCPTAHTNIQDAYAALSPMSKALFSEYWHYLELRDHVLATDAESDLRMSGGHLIRRT